MIETINSFKSFARKGYNANDFAFTKDNYQEIPKINSPISVLYAGLIEHQKVLNNSDYSVSIFKIDIVGLIIEATKCERTNKKLSDKNFTCIMIGNEDLISETTMLALMQGVGTDVIVIVHELGMRIVATEHAEFNDLITDDPTTILGEEEEKLFNIANLVTNDDDDSSTLEQSLFRLIFKRKVLDAVTESTKDFLSKHGESIADLLKSMKSE